MKFLFLICTSFLFFITNLPAQNLVPNPGFEEITGCPVNDSNKIEKAKYWFSTNKNDSPDIYNECAGKEQYYPWHYKVPYVLPKSGKGYAGMECFTGQMEVRLKSPLVKNKTYSVQMYVCTPFNERPLFSYPSILRFCFTKDVLTKKYMVDSVIDRRVIRIVNSDSNRSVHTKWKLFSARYRAKGGENYLTFGGLNRSDIMDKKLMYDNQGRKINPFTAYYYYIDDVSVEEVTAASSLAPAQQVK